MFDFVHDLHGRRVSVERTRLSSGDELPDGVEIQQSAIVLEIGTTLFHLPLADARQLLYDLAAAVTEDDAIAENVWRAVQQDRVTGP